MPDMAAAEFLDQFVAPVNTVALDFPEGAVLSVTDQETLANIVLEGVTVSLTETDSTLTVPEGSDIVVTAPEGYEIVSSVDEHGNTTYAVAYTVALESNYESGPAAVSEVVSCGTTFTLDTDVFARTGYTFADVSANHTIEVTFVPEGGPRPLPSDTLVIVAAAIVLIVAFGIMVLSRRW